MSKKTESKTEEETYLLEAIFGLGSHYKTTISNGVDKVEGRGNTAEKAEEIASNRWKDKKK